LQHESATSRDTIATTSDEDRAAWKRAVEAYRARFGQRLPWVDPELVALHDALSRTAENSTPSGIPDAVRDVLVRAAPFAGPVGAFTTGDVKVTHTTISSLHPNYRGVFALEMMLHESSHGVFKRGDNPRYVPLLETTWQQHIDGKLSLDDAINAMITQLAAKK
jgi:hypothetical protein